MQLFAVVLAVAMTSCLIQSAIASISCIQCPIEEFPCNGSKVGSKCKTHFLADNADTCYTLFLKNGTRHGQIRGCVKGDSCPALSEFKAKTYSFDNSVALAGVKNGCITCNTDNCNDQVRPTVTMTVLNSNGTKTNGTDPSNRCTFRRALVVSAAVALMLFKT